MALFACSVKSTVILIDNIYFVTNYIGTANTNWVKFSIQCCEKIPAVIKSDLRFGQVYETEKDFDKSKNVKFENSEQ